MPNHHHDGHRDRVRRRFLYEGGLNNFEEHQILELLLFYAIPRRDTNELAHKLLKEFGDLDILLNAEPEAISSRTGVSLNTAILISLAGKLSRRCIVQKSGNMSLKNTEQTKKYFIELLKNSPVEIFYIVCLDKNKRIIKPIKVAEGDREFIVLKLNSVLADISRYGTVYAVCAHNHPNFTQDFSIDDNTSTMIIKQRLAEYNVKLLDHILVCGDKAIAMSELKKFKF